MQSIGKQRKEGWIIIVTGFTCFQMEEGMFDSECVSLCAVNLIFSN